MLYFIYGNESKDLELFKIIEDIKSKNQGIMSINFDAAQGEESDFLSKISAVSLFPVNEYYHLKRSESIKDFMKFCKALEKYDYKNKTVIIEYLEGRKKVTKKYLNILENIGNVIQSRDKNLSDKIEKYVQKELETSKKESYQLVQMIGTDFHKIKNEIEKIKIYLNGEKFDIKEIEKVISKEDSYATYELTEKMFSNKVEEVIRYAQNHNAHMMIFYSLIKDLFLRYKLALIKEQNSFPNSTNYNSFKNLILPEVDKKIKMHPFALFKKYESLNKFKIDRLKNDISLALKAERSIRTGISNDKIEIEVFLRKF